MRKIWLGVVVAFVLGFVCVFMPIPALAMTGSGTSGDPYMVYNATDLQDMSNNLTAYYQLANDIDASVTETWNWDAGRGVYEGFVPVAGFAGNFNGNYHGIYGLYMDWEATYCCVGLFGSLNDNAVIQDVRIIGANITNKYTHASSSGTVGVLVGTIYYKNDITISRVMVEGKVTNHFTSSASIRGCAGGMVGYIWHGSGHLIEECAAYVDVVQNSYGASASSFAGGFVGVYANGGSPDSWIRNCYARGDASAYGAYLRDAGGFCGWQDGTNNRIDDCYSTGVPIGWAGGFVGQGGECSVVTNCFWDTESSGIGTSDCGTGKTTAEMQAESTFTDAGWDFSSVWGIDGAYNDGYPYLQWWYEEYTWPGSFTQVTWFQPNAIIEETTLPDRMSNQDGDITWGANPAGISISIGGFMSEYQLPMYVLPADIVEPPLDMVGSTGQPGWTSDIPSLTGHPFYPIVAMIGNQTGIPIKLVWVILATLILLIAMMVCYRYAPHQIITVIVGGSICAFWYHMEIYPFWVIFIFVVMGVAIIIGERSPTVS